MNMQSILSASDSTDYLEVVHPEQADHCGGLQGAYALLMMGRAALACATNYASCAVVMRKADEIEFSRHIPVGSIVDIRARVVFQGRSSMTVIVELTAENSAAVEDTPCISGRFMMVAVNGSGAPIVIPASS